MPQWNLEQCLNCIPRAHLTLRQSVLQQVQICWISTAIAHCTNGPCLSHTVSFTVPCVVTHSVTCLNLMPMPPQFFHFKKIGTEVKILSSGRHNRMPHKRLVVILDAGSKTRYQILKLLWTESNWKFFECKCEKKRVGMFDMKITRLVRACARACVCGGDVCVYVRMYVCTYVYMHYAQTDVCIYMH
jgi:hypothetical protein